MGKKEIHTSRVALKAISNGDDFTPWVAFVVCAKCCQYAPVTGMDNITSWNEMTEKSNNAWLTAMIGRVASDQKGLHEKRNCH